MKRCVLILSLFTLIGCSTSQDVATHDTKPHHILNIDNIKHIDDYCGKLIELKGIALKSTRGGYITVGQMGIWIANAPSWPDYCLNKPVTVYGLLCRADPTPEEIENQKFPTTAYLQSTATCSPRKPYYYIIHYVLPKFDYDADPWD